VNKNGTNERDWRFLKGLVIGLALMALLTVLPARSSGYSTRLTHRVDTKVQSANACRPWLGAPRFAVRRTYARQSSAFRRWALRFWAGRATRCGYEKARVGVPPWFRSVMLCIHPKESSDWYNAGHHEGGLQFAYSTWVSAGGQQFAAHAYEATPNEQIRAAFDLTDGSSRGLRWHWAATIGGCL
jgi:hypothetical protein